MRKKGTRGLARHGAGQERLAGPRRPDQEDPLGDLGPQRPVVFGMAQEIDDLPQLGFRLVAAGHVVEGHADVTVGDELRPALAEAQDRFSGGAEATEEGHPEQHHDANG